MNNAGIKHDQDKPQAGLLLDFSRALMAVAEVGTFGADKYTKRGWITVPKGIERYTNAMVRHQLMEQQEMYDADSGMPHEYMVAWNALARLELMLKEEEYAIEQQLTHYDENAYNRNR